MNQQQPQQQERPHDFASPTRVRHAMDVIDLFTGKTQPRAAVGPVNIEVIPGQELTKEEKAVLAAASTCLVDYFNGQLDPNQYELIRITLASHEVRQHQMREMTIVNAKCPACGGQDDPVYPTAKCELCLGLHTVRVIRPE